METINPMAENVPSSVPPKKKSKKSLAGNRSSSGATLRKGHAWTVGIPGTYTDTDLRRLSGRYICCSGCTSIDYEEGHCHTAKLVAEFIAKNPDLPPPKFVSAATTTIEGAGGLREVLIEKDAVWCATRTARGAPTARELHIRLPFSKFGNPEKLRKWAAAKEQRQKGAKRPRE